MKIIIDIDGVLADFITGFRTIADEMFSEKELEIFSHTDMRSWCWNPGLDDYEISRVWDFIKASSEFWLKLSRLCSTTEAAVLRTLCNVHDVYFVTNRKGNRVKQQTEWWLKRNIGIDNPTVIISKNKGEMAKAIRADYLVEDKADNAIFTSWYTEGKTQAYLIDRQYNRFDPNYYGSHKVKRVKSLLDFLDDIQIDRQRKVSNRRTA